MAQKLDLIERKDEYFSKNEALLFVAGEDGIRVRQLAELLSLPTDRHPNRV